MPKTNHATQGHDTPDQDRFHHRNDIRRESQGQNLEQMSQITRLLWKSGAELETEPRQASAPLISRKDVQLAEPKGKGEMDTSRREETGPQAQGEGNAGNIYDIIVFFFFLTRNQQSTWREPQFQSQSQPKITQESGAQGPINETAPRGKPRIGDPMEEKVHHGSESIVQPQTCGGGLAQASYLSRGRTDRSPSVPAAPALKRAGNDTAYLRRKPAATCSSTGEKAAMRRR
jgi:hypothetical protein